MRVQYDQRFNLPLKPTETLRGALDELERALIKDALEYANGNHSEAARALNMNRTTLLAAMQRLKVKEVRRANG